MLANWQTISRELRTNRIELTALRLNRAQRRRRNLTTYSLPRRSWEKVHDEVITLQPAPWPSKSGVIKAFLALEETGIKSL